MECNVTNMIFEKMMACITSGEWKAGCKIPTENELAIQFHASRNSVRQAIARLKALELIESRRGSGTMLKKCKASTTLTDFLPTIMFETEDNLQIFEFHKGIQIECAKLACFRRTEDQIEKLINESKLMGQCYSQADVRGAIKHDLEYHMTVCEMSNNIMFVRATELIYQHLEQSFIQICSSFDYHDSMVLHERMIAAFEDRNSVFAASLMESHQWDTYQKHLLLVQQHNTSASKLT